MKIIFIIFLISSIISINLVFAEDNSEFNLFQEEYKPGNISPRAIHHDLTMIDFEILEVQKMFIPKWIDEPGDYSDIIQVKFNVTNNELKNFVVYKDMFQIDVIDPNKHQQEIKRNIQDYVVDNYFPQYIEDFKLRFQDISLPQNIFECELLNHTLRINQTQTLSVCFDVKQKWSNQPLNLEGPRLYYIVMMDNKFASSCPNCESALLNQYYKNASVQKQLSLKTQLSLGIPVEDISCRENFQLVFKNSGEPACVKHTSIEKLIERGWIIS